MTSPSDRVTFNLTGTKFEASSNTYDKLKGLSDESKFMIEEASKFRSSESKMEIFLEREPACFAALLYFCQGGTLHVPPSVCPEVFMKEMKQWGIQLSRLDNCCYNTMLSFNDDRATVEKFQKGFLFSKAKLGTAFTSPWQSLRCRAWSILDSPFSSGLAKVYFAMCITFLLLSLFSMVVSTHPDFRREMDISEWEEALGDSFNKYRSFLGQEFGWMSNWDDDDSDIVDSGAKGDHTVRKRSAGKEYKSMPQGSESADVGSSGSEETYDARIGTNSVEKTRSADSGRQASLGIPRLSSSKVEKLNKASPRLKRAASLNWPSATDTTEEPDMTSSNDTDMTSSNDTDMTSFNDTANATSTNSSSMPTPVDDSNTARVGLEEPSNFQNFGARYVYLTYIDMACMAFFCIDFLLRFCFCPKFSSFFCNLLTLADLVALVAGFIKLIVDKQFPEEKYTLSNLDLIDCLQIFRFLRFIRMARDVIGFRVLVHSVKASAYELLLLVMFLSSGVLFFSTLVYWCDRDNMESIPDSFWWAIITMTTVGYGDMSPKTFQGKIVGSLCAISGVVLIAITIPVLVNNFLLFYGYSKVIQARMKEAKQKQVQDTWTGTVDEVLRRSGSCVTHVQVQPANENLGDILKDEAFKTKRKYSLYEVKEMPDKAKDAE